MAIVGKARSYQKKYNFSVDIDGISVAWFESCSPIEGEVGVTEQREGGSVSVANKSPGLMKVSPVTLKVGATDNDELYNWWLQVVDAAGLGGKGAGRPDGGYERQVAIVQRDRDGTPLRTWVLNKAWPSKFVAGDWDAKSEDNVINEITLVYLYFTKG